MGYDEFLKDYAAYRKISVEDLFAVLEEIWQNSKGYRTIGDWFGHVERYGGNIKREQNCKKKCGRGCESDDNACGKKGWNLIRYL